LYKELSLNANDPALIIAGGMQEEFLPILKLWVHLSLGKVCVMS